MNFLIAENIPYANELFSTHGQVERFAGREPEPRQLQHADVLLVRSITKVDEALLQYAPNLKFVGTATIGMEHLNIKSLEKRDIHYVNSPGANADSVGEYVLTAILALAEKHGWELKGQRVAIVGAGNTGQAAGQRLQALGLTVDYYDPPRDETEDDFSSIDFEQVLSADIISLHVPLTTQGKHATKHLFNEKVLKKLKPNQLLVNASRGAVINNQDLLKHINSKGLHVVLDVWEGEPSVLSELVEVVDIATPHIAGHSLNGKVHGSQMLYDACVDYFDWHDAKLDWASLYTAPEQFGWSCKRVPKQSVLATWVLQNYDIWADDARMRETGTSAQGFDQLRKDYPVRYELCSQFLRVPDSMGELSKERLRHLGFTI